MKHSLKPRWLSILPPNSIDFSERKLQNKEKKALSTIYFLMFTYLDAQRLGEYMTGLEKKEKEREQASKGKSPEERVKKWRLLGI